MEEYIIGEHKDIAIYMIAENGKRTYMHALNVFEFFNTLDDTLYDIEVKLLNIRFGKGCK